jgi:hypothetical protein
MGLNPLLVDANLPLVFLADPDDPRAKHPRSRRARRGFADVLLIRPDKPACPHSGRPLPPKRDAFHVCGRAAGLGVGHAGKLSAGSLDREGAMPQGRDSWLCALDSKIQPSCQDFPAALQRGARKATAKGRVASLESRCEYLVQGWTGLSLSCLRSTGHLATSGSRPSLERRLR